jgi:hypothetical protein
MTATPTTIEIFGRVRPPKKNSKINHEVGKYEISEDIEGTPTVKFHVPKDIQQGLINHKKEIYDFKFKKIFDQDSEQEEVFNLVAKPVVDRYKVLTTVFYKVTMAQYSHMVKQEVGKRSQLRGVLKVTPTVV